MKLKAIIFCMAIGFCSNTYAGSLILENETIYEFANDYWQYDVNGYKKVGVRQITVDLAQSNIVPNSIKFNLSFCKRRENQILYETLPTMVNVYNKSIVVDITNNWQRWNTCVGRFNAEFRSPYATIVFGKKDTNDGETRGHKKLLIGGVDYYCGGVECRDTTMAVPASYFRVKRQGAKVIMSYPDALEFSPRDAKKELARFSSIAGDPNIEISVSDAISDTVGQLAYKVGGKNIIKGIFTDIKKDEVLSAELVKVNGWGNTSGRIVIDVRLK